MIYIRLCCLQMEKLIMELTRLMNGDIIHLIYTTTKSKLVNILTVRWYENDGQRNCEFTFKITQIIRLQA